MELPMAAESLITTASDGTSDVTFNKVSQNAYTSRFAGSANTATLKEFIDIDHKVAPIGSLASDVHTVTYRLEGVDADTLRVSVAKVSLQITVPKGDVITMSNVGNGISHVMCLMKKAFMDGFVLGETPTGDYNVTGPFNPVRA